MPKLFSVTLICPLSPRNDAYYPRFPHPMCDLGSGLEWTEPWRALVSFLSTCEIDPVLQWLIVIVSRIKLSSNLAYAVSLGQKRPFGSRQLTRCGEVC